MVRITLHGKLAEIAGQTDWHLDVRTATEALRAVDANCGGRLRAHLATNLYSEYRVLLDAQDFRTLDDIANPHRPLTSVDFIPVLQGAGNGWLQVLVGVVLFAVTWWAGGAGAWTYSGVQGASAIAATGSGALLSAGTTSFLYTVAAAVTLGGISSIIAGSPTAPSFQSSERPENRPSYLFSGAINTTQQGNPVPIGYGRLRVGSQVVSAGIRSQEIPLT